MSHRIAVAVGIAGALLIAGCPQPQGDQSEAVRVAGPGFSVTLPASAVAVDPGVGIPGATFQAFYEDDLGYLYAVYSIDVGSLAVFSGDEANPSFRFDGTGTTSSGDFVILATVPGQYGDVTAAMAQLADGQLLYVGVDASNPMRNVVFASIDLADTDGTAIEDNAADGVPLLAAPVKGDLLVLDDQSVFRVSGSADLLLTRNWSIGDPIMWHDSADFSWLITEFFLTKVGQWESVSADYVGLADLLTIESVVDLEYGSVEITLSDDTVWRVAYSDENVARTWEVGDNVALCEDPWSFLGYTMIRLSTGASVVVEPS